MVVEHIRQIKEKVFCVYIQESYMQQCGWKAEQVISLHPNENGLEIVGLNAKD